LHRRRPCRRTEAGVILQPIDPQFVSFERLEAFQLARGVTAKALFGEGAMLNLVELEPGGVVTRHSHPHEQLGLVLRGSMTLNVEGTDHRLEAMDGYALPGDVEHGAIAGPEGALVLDVFRPVREDYRQAAGA
jgi:quercetin dioxygenase-like cupin family protein